MKKLLITSILMTMLSTFSYSQLEFGAGATIILENTTFFGVQGKVGFGVTEEIDGMATVSYFLESSNVSILTLDADAHYQLLTLGSDENITMSVLGGLHYGRSSFDILGVSSSDGDLGLNAGVHFRLPISGMNIYAEPKFILGGDINGLVVSAGVMF